MKFSACMTQCHVVVKTLTTFHPACETIPNIRNPEEYSVETKPSKYVALVIPLFLIRLSLQNVLVPSCSCSLPTQLTLSHALGNNAYTVEEWYNFPTQYKVPIAKSYGSFKTTIEKYFLHLQSSAKIMRLFIYFYLLF